jgi:hypothetical protein
MLDLYSIILDREAQLASTMEGSADQPYADDGVFAPTMLAAATASGG